MSPKHSLVSRFVFISAAVTFTAIALAGGPPRTYQFVGFDVPSPSGPLETSIFGINESGSFVGNYLDESGDIAAFYSRDGKLATFRVEESPVSSLSGINSAGTAVGAFVNEEGFWQGFVYHPDGTIEKLDPPVSGVNTFANGINDRGDVVGWFTFDFSTSIGFVYRDGEYHSLFIIPGGFAYPLDINNRGTIVGQLFTDAGQLRGFIRERSGAITIYEAPGADPFWTTLQGINNQGDMVGTYLDAEGTYRGFVLSKGAFQSLLYPGAFDTDAFDIAENGTIVGTYNYYTGGFIAYPIR